VAVDPPRLEVGRIARVHGLRGEVVVTLTTTETDRVTAGSHLWAGDRPLVVAAARPHQHRWIVRFEDLTTVESADELRGAVLYADVLASTGDDLWVHELIGAIVIDVAGQQHGRVAAVVANPASDLLELDSGALVPLRFVVGGVEDGDEGRTVRIDPPAGLFGD
jgi:16S rRNA processing protein RimM